jgi:predicted transport protein
MNKTFASLYEFIDLGQYLESVQAQFLLLQSYRRLPTDQEFVEALKSSDLYNFRRRSYLLRKLENFGRKEPVSIEEYTIEHILPQNPGLSPEWQAELGEQWQEIQEKYLHTLGNLTLTGYNSEYSDNPFLVKRDMKGGFFESPLRLNAGIGKLEKWSQAQIEARAERLSKEALSIWVSPKLSGDIVAKYKKSEKQAESVYGLQDHPNLFVSIERQQLFERFSNAVLDLDPVVTMHVLKLYVAFKAETNFVDVIPQKSKLLLSLNIPATEIVDPRGIARDVSKISRWGNGPYEVELSENSDFDYVFGLVRQAFDIQLEEDIS